MKILALEFSSEQRSVAVLQPETRRAGTAATSHAGAASAKISEVVETGGRSTQAIGMIEAALQQAQVEREQIDCLAIGLGPGSYTGIRAAIALAQGWQLARDVKLLGLSSAECIAAQAQGDGLTGRVAVVIDAQRGEFYLANYDLDAAGWRELKPLRLASKTEVQETEKAGEILAGPEVTSWFPASRLVFPRAATLARLAVARADFVSGEQLEPIYLRATTFVKAPPPRVIPD